MSMIDIGKDDKNNMAIYPSELGYITFNVRSGKRNAYTELDIRQTKLVIEALNTMIVEYENECKRY